MKDVTWGKLYPEKKGIGSRDGVEHGVCTRMGSARWHAAGGRKGGEEEDKKPPGRTGQQEYYCKVTVGMGSLSMSESRANGC